MSIETIGAGRLPATRTWTIDSNHSSIRFAVKHHAVATYRAGFGEFQGQYDAGARTFTGTVQTASVQTFEMLRNDLVGDRFFQADQYPTISFVSSSVEEEDGALTVDGDLTLKVETGRANLTLGQLAAFADALNAGLDVQLPLIERQHVKLRDPHLMPH